MEARKTNSYPEDEDFQNEKKEEKDIIKLEEIFLEKDNDNIATQLNPINLKYLNRFNQQELEILQAKFKQSLPKLENIVARNSKRFWFERIMNDISLLSNLLYLIFIIKTSNDGFKTFVHEINPNIPVSDFVAYLVNTPLATGDALVYVFTFSSAKEAIISTINVDSELAFKIKIKKLIKEAQYHPKKSIQNLLHVFANQTVLLTTNSLGTMTEIIEIIDQLNTLPFLLKWTLISLILGFGIRYHEKFMNEDYYRELYEFWGNKKKLPWLFSEVMNGEFAIPLQIFIQGMISTVLIRSIFFYYIALATEEALGFGIPPLLGALLVGWHSACVLYPSTYYNYYAKEIEIRALFKGENTDEKIKKIEHQLEKLNITNLNGKDLEKLNATYMAFKIKFKKLALQKQIEKEQGYFYLLKQEKFIILPILYRAGTGAYFGWECIGPFLNYLFQNWIDVPLLTSIAGGTIGCVVFGKILYDAEKKRVLAKLIYEKIKKEETPIHDLQIPKSQTCAGGLLTIMGLWMVFGNGISGGMSTIGVGTRLFGDSAIANTIGTIIAFESMINSVLYMKDKVMNVVYSVFRCKSPSRTFGTMFHESKNLVEKKNILSEEKLLPEPS